MTLDEFYIVFSIFDGWYDQNYLTSVEIVLEYE